MQDGYFLYLIKITGLIRVKPKYKLQPQDILIQVDKICSSSELNTKLQLSKLLRYLVDETLAGRAENLKGFTIGLEVFKKEKDFDPERDPIVRIHAGRLRRMLKMYFLETGMNDPIKIEIPKGKYIPVFLDNVLSEEDPKPKMMEKPDPPKYPSIALFLFKNLTGNPDNDYFARGFSEELSVELTKYEDLIIYNCMPSSGLNYTDLNIHEFIRDKGVRFMVDGSIQFDNRQVKILVKLTDIMEGEQIWAESYQRGLSAGNLIEIQEKIALEIAVILGAEYGVILQRLLVDSVGIKPQNMDTYTAIYKFYHFQATQTIEAATQAFRALDEALKKDPGSEIAMALLASMHGNRYLLNFPDAEKSFKLAGELAENAMKINPVSLTVRTVIVFKCFVYNEKDRFFREVENCLSKNPNNSMRLGALGFYLSLYGDWERGKEILDRVMNANIGYPLYYHGSTSLYYFRKKEYEKALAEADKYDIPALFWAPMLRVTILGKLRRSGEARPHIDHLMRLKPDFEEKARYLVSRFVKEEVLVELVIEGLTEAGMSIQ